MAENKEKIDYGQELFSWSVPEYEKHERTKGWYTIAIIITLVLLIISSFSISLSPFKLSFSPNFLFYVIVIITALIIILRHGEEPENVKFVITDEGLIIGRKFYDYDGIENFAIVYKPRLDAKKLYFEFNNAIKHRLSIPLENMNPLPIREALLDYLEEDLERTDIPLSEALARLFKL